jgi:enamine deaminase RidA (YjgF/YER057c/UK114 family)
VPKAAEREENASPVMGLSSVLHQNLAVDTPFDLRIYGANATLHGGNLCRPPPDHNGVLLHETAEGDTWLQLVRQQKNGERLDAAVYGAYREILSCAAKTKGNLVRIWNHIPSILSLDEGEIRYHRFNAGRLKAWQEYGPKNEDGQLVLPAATGIGTAEQALFIRAFVSPHPVIRPQNPSQTPPAQYSRKYGALPPLFSRASILLKPRQHAMYASGTASIIGEDTIHLGDPVSQTRQSLKNICAIIDRENLQRHGYGGNFAFTDMKSMRVYVKNPDQFDMVRKTVEAEISCPVTYKHCDICREELLVEIECIFETAV